MNFLRHIVFLALICAGLSGFTPPAHAVFVDSYSYTVNHAPPGGGSCVGDYYWVGGTATWDNTAGSKWATASGGAGGSGPPTSADDVCIDANSGSGTITLAATAAALTVDFTGFTGTLSHPASTTWTISGGLTMASGMTYTLGNAATSATTFNAASGSFNINPGGKTFGNIVFNGASGSWTLTGALTASNSTTGTITLTDGSLDTNGQTVNTGRIVSSNSNTRTLTLGASTINLAGSSSAAVDFTTATNLTFSGASSTINLTGTAPSFEGGGLTYGTVDVSSLTFTLNGANSFTNLTRTGTVSTLASLLLGANQTITGTFTANGNSATNRLYIASSTRGTARTITAAAISINAADFEDITGAGAASWDMSGASNFVGLCGGNTSLTGTTPASMYWVGSTGSWNTVAEWATTSGGTGGGAGARVPICSDTGVFDANSIDTTSRTVTINAPRIGPLDASAITNNPILSRSADVVHYGGMSWASSSNGTGNQIDTWAGRGSYTVTLGTGDWPSGSTMIVDAPGGTLSLGANFDFTSSGSSNVFTLTRGTLDFNDFNVTNLSALQSNNSNTRTLKLGTGTLNMTRTGSTSTPVDFTTTTGLTFDAETSTIVFDAAGTAVYTWQTGGLTFNNITVKDRTSTGSLRFAGSPTIANLTLEQDSSVGITASTTVTVSGTVTCAGASGQTITLASSTTTNATLSKSSGTVACSWITINDITGSGGATFSATNSTCSDATNWSCS